jgi:hypothetical protein
MDKFMDVVRVVNPDDATKVEMVKFLMSYKQPQQPSGIHDQTKRKVITSILGRNIEILYYTNHTSPYYEITWKDTTPQNDKTHQKVAEVKMTSPDLITRSRRFYYHNNERVTEEYTIENGKVRDTFIIDQVSWDHPTDTSNYIKIRADTNYIEHCGRVSYTSSQPNSSNKTSP